MPLRDVPQVPSQEGEQPLHRTQPPSTSLPPASLSPLITPPSVRRRCHKGSLSPTGSQRDCSQPVSPSDGRYAPCNAYSTSDRPSTGDGDSNLADGDAGQDLSEASVDGDYLHTYITSSGGSLVGTMSTAGSFKNGNRLSQSTVYNTDDMNPALLWSNNDGSIR